METDFALMAYYTIGLLILIVSSLTRLVYKSVVLDAIIVMSAINALVLLLWSE